MALVATGDRDDQSQIAVDEPLLGDEIATLDALRQLELFRGAQEPELVGALQELIESVGMNESLVSEGVLRVEQDPPSLNSDYYSRYCTPDWLLMQPPWGSPTLNATARSKDAVASPSTPGGPTSKVPAFLRLDTQEVDVRSRLRPNLCASYAQPFGQFRVFEGFLGGFPSRAARVRAMKSRYHSPLRLTVRRWVS